ncbi:MAG: hypothetical protein ACLPLP_12615 [Mycobacterium sp.]
MTGPLVVLRCQRCGTRLGSLDAMPTDWSGTLRISRCLKCVVPDGALMSKPNPAALELLRTGKLPEDAKPRRRSRLVEVLAQQGVSGFPLTAEIPLAELRADAMKANKRGRGVSVNVAPVPRAR